LNACKFPILRSSCFPINLCAFLLQIVTQNGIQCIVLQIHWHFLLLFMVVEDGLHKRIMEWLLHKKIQESCQKINTCLHHPPNIIRSMMQALMAFQIQGLQTLDAILVMLLLLIIVVMSNTFFKTRTKWCAKAMFNTHWNF